MLVGSSLTERIVRALMVELVAEVIEAPLLLGQGGSGWRSGLGFERLVHPLVPVLRGLGWRDTFRHYAELAQLKLLVDCRGQLLAMRTAERNPLSQAPKVAAQKYRAHDSRARARTGRGDHELSERVDRSARFKALAEQLTSVPGVGPVLANVLLARLPELVRLNRGEIAAPVGSHP